MTLDAFLSLLIFLCIVGFGIFIKFYVPAYLKKKAENLATKEDIAEVTRQIELVKGKIGSQLYIHQTRYQNEFNILMDLSEKLVELRDSALSLRPVVDSANTYTDEEKGKRLNRYFEVANDLYKLCETRKPFYPDEIYNEIKKIGQITWKEVVEYQLGSDPRARRDPQYWKTASDNAQKISEMANETMGLVRNRVKYWEEFRA